MKKRILSVLTATALAAASFSALAINAAAEEDIVYEGITFAPWTSTTSLPTSGSYYLTGDVSVSAVNNLMQGQKLDLLLNGHSITKTGSNSSSVYNLGNGSVFSLYDNSSEIHYYTPNDGAAATVGSGDSVFYGGYITGAAACFIQLINRGTFNMYGGNIVGMTSKSGSSVSVNGGTFNMYDGAILGCYSSYSGSGGGGVSVMSGGTFNMCGGAIKDNRTKGFNFGGGVFFSSGTFNVSGDVVIRDNKRGGTIENVYFKNGSKLGIGEDGLSANADIGLSPEFGVALPLVLVDGAAGYEDAFVSDYATASLALNQDGQLVMTAEKLATAVYEKESDEDFTSETETDNIASLWTVTVTTGSESITDLRVKVKDTEGKFHGSEDVYDRPVISGGSVVVAVVVNHAAADVAGITTAVNGLDITATTASE